MDVCRKRKHAAADEPTECLPTRRGMQIFNSVTKPAATDESGKKRKTRHGHQPTPPAITLTRPTPAKSNQKRKRSLDSVAEDSEEDQPEAPIRVFKQFAKKSNKRMRKAPPPSPVQTPSKDAAAMFDKLKLDAESIPFSLAEKPIAYDTPPDTPETERIMPDLVWPTELQQLCRLYASFLTALSLHYAHNGSSSSADVATLLPMITKQWRVRTVTLDDLRLLFAVGQVDFYLEDGGAAGICLRRHQSKGRKQMRSYIDEDDMNCAFEDALQARWIKWQAAAGKENSDAATFVQQLSLANVTKSASAQQTGPLFARGQQRLADIRSAQAQVAQAIDKPAANQQQSAQSRGSTLLDRILAKQAITASMPAGPTKAELERKAALHRIEEVARVLSSMVIGKNRVSLSMPAMVLQLQQSLRNPIDKDEVERCLVLMEREITPGFVSVVVTGVVKGVVVSRVGQIGTEQVRRRVEKAVA